MKSQKDFPAELVLESIGRLMRFNVFTFGSKLFLHKNGILVGTNVGCMYATINYSYHEEKRFLCLSFVHFYHQLINEQSLTKSRKLYFFYKNYE